MSSISLNAILYSRGVLVMSTKMYLVNGTLLNRIWEPGGTNAIHRIGDFYIQWIQKKRIIPARSLNDPLYHLQEVPPGYLDRGADPFTIDNPASFNAAPRRRRGPAGCKEDNRFSRTAVDSRSKLEFLISRSSLPMHNFRVFKCLKSDTVITSSFFVLCSWN